MPPMPPNHMLARKESIYSLRLLSLIEKSQERDITQSSMYGIYLKFIQVIYTSNTNCVSNIMTLAQAAIQILCLQCALWLKGLSLKRGIIQSNIYRILRKVNQVPCIMCSNSIPDIMILAKAGFLMT